MQKVIPITDVYAREILDSRGNPTIEVEVLAGGKYVGRADVPSGASTGKYEAIELRDGGKRYHGKGVQKAVDHVNNDLAKELIGCNVLDQRYLDQLMIQADGTDNKNSYGANAILGISMAASRAAADALQLPLYAYIGGMHKGKLPVPMMNVINGGAHAANTIDVQEFMIMPVGADCFKEGLRMCAEIYQELKRLLDEQGLSTAVGDEGGFAPNLPNTKEALKILAEAVRAAGYELEEDVVFAMDVAASELYNTDFKKYVFPGESKMQGHQVIRSTEELIEYYEELVSEFPICSIEDPLDEEDWDGWQKMTELFGDEIQLVGDDLFVTNVRRLKKGISIGAANAILVKVNQIGTLTEAMDAINMAKKAGYRTIISHRSGETEDPFIADLAVAVDARQIKSGAPCRAERVAKYNQLLRIEEELEK